MWSQLRHWMTRLPCCKKYDQFLTTRYCLLLALVALPIQTKSSLQCVKEWLLFSVLSDSLKKWTSLKHLRRRERSQRISQVECDASIRNPYQVLLRQPRVYNSHCNGNEVEGIINSNRIGESMQRFYSHTGETARMRRTCEASMVLI